MHVPLPQVIQIAKELHQVGRKALLWMPMSSCLIPESQKIPYCFPSQITCVTTLVILNNKRKLSVVLSFLKAVVPHTVVTPPS